MVKLLILKQEHPYPMSILPAKTNQKLLLLAELQIIKVIF
jgi:hypothetical protein